MLERARSKIAAISAAGASRAGEDRRKAAALRDFERRLPLLRKAGRYEEALRLCEQVLASPAPASVHAQARTAREPLELMAEFVEAALCGAR